MGEALQEAIEQLIHAQDADDYIRILKAYYKAHTLEILEQLERQHNVASLLDENWKCEGTD